MMAKVKHNNSEAQFIVLNLNKAYREGFNDGRNGTENHNPYDENTSSYDDYERGYGAGYQKFCDESYGRGL